MNLLPETPVLIRPSRIRQLLLATLSCLAATPGLALVLGEARVRSHLGFPLSITVPFSADAGEEILPECIQLGGSGEGYVRGASIRVDMQRSGGNIVIQTRAAMQEPVVRLYLQVSCSPKGQQARDYSLLLDPAPHGEPQAEQTVVAAYPLQWVAREGDSLLKLARQLYPGQSRNQQRFVQAALQANPQVSSAAQHLPAGVVLALPSPSQVRAVRLEPVSPPATDIATTPPTVATPKPAVSKPAPQPKPAAPKPAGGSVSVTVGGVLPEPPMAPATGTFGLKLSYDLTEPATPMTEAQRAQLRQKMQLINSDDQLAYLLNLQTQMQQMQGELQQLKQQRSVPAGAVPASTAANVPVAAAQSATAPAREGESHWSRYGWWYAAGGLILLVMVWAVWRYRQRQESDNSWYFEDGPAPVTPEIDQPTQLTMVHPLDQPAPAGLREPAASNELGNVPLRNEQIVVEDGDRWAVEEAQVFLSHGWVEHAVSLLTEEVDKNPYHLDLWLMLFEIHKQHGMTEAFDALADRFREIAYGLPIWDKVQAMRDEMHEGEAVAADGADAVEVDVALPAAEAVPLTSEPEMMTLDVPPLSFELGESEGAAVAPSAKVAAAPQASSDTLDFDLELTFDPPQEGELPPALTHSAGHAKAAPSPDFDLLDFEVDTPPPAEKPSRR